MKKLVDLTWNNPEVLGPLEPRPYRIERNGVRLYHSDLIGGVLTLKGFSSVNQILCMGAIVRKHRRRKLQLYILLDQGKKNLNHKRCSSCPVFNMKVLKAFRLWSGFGQFDVNSCQKFSFVKIFSQRWHFFQSCHLPLPGLRIIVSLSRKIFGSLLADFTF